MSSQAFQSFVSAIEEIEVLGTASHPSLAVNRANSLRIARAVGRGQIVLLSAHFERYIYALNEELVAFINSQRIHGDRLTDILRLQHSMTPIDSLALTGWDRRAVLLAEFVSSDAWLWTVGNSGNHRSHTPPYLDASAQSQKSGAILQRLGNPGHLHRDNSKTYLAPGVLVKRARPCRSSEQYRAWRLSCSGYAGRCEGIYEANNGILQPYRPQNRHRHSAAIWHTGSVVETDHFRQNTHDPRWSSRSRLVKGTRSGGTNGSFPSMAGHILKVHFRVARVVSCTM